MANSDLALTGIKVLDISRGFSGGYCTKILRDLGAEVIKVEIPNSGDTCRTFGPFHNDIPDIETSAPYLYLNAGKKASPLTSQTLRLGIHFWLCAKGQILSWKISSQDLCLKLIWDMMLSQPLIQK